MRQLALLLGAAAVTLTGCDDPAATPEAPGPPTLAIVSGNSQVERTMNCDPAVAAGASRNRT